MSVVLHDSPTCVIGWRRRTTDWPKAGDEDKVGGGERERERERERASNIEREIDRVGECEREREKEGKKE